MKSYIGKNKYAQRAMWKHTGKKQEERREKRKYDEKRRLK